MILFIVVDQARADYLERFRPAFEGGFKRLLDDGLVFTRAFHQHAVTNTGPGHAALITGRNPGPAGIIDNEWFNRKSASGVYCVEDAQSPLLSYGPSLLSGDGRSPKNLLVTALPDWLRRRYPASKIFSASRKDRAAVILGGHAADAAYWVWPKTAEFITSSYYPAGYPPWMSAFRSRSLPQKRFGQPWTPLAETESHAGWMGVKPIERGAMTPRFPHHLGKASLEPGPSFYSSFTESPFVDEYLAEFAVELIAKEALGRDEIPDYLGLSFSAVDYVGHKLGPDSPELFDTILRLDRVLGRLLKFVDEKVGLDRTIVVLSSDHGVVPLPESRPGPPKAARSGTAEVVCLQQTAHRLETLFGPGPWFLQGHPYFDYQRLGQANLSRGALEKAAAGWLAGCPSVARVWTRSQLESPKHEGEDPLLERYRASFHPDRSPDLILQYQSHHLSRLKDGTTHGTPYDYDSHVPLILLLPNRQPGRITRRVRTVDVAPTLASLLGLSPPPSLDGTDLLPRSRPE